MTRKYIKNGVYIKINDIFDDLSEENKRLENELMFANNCLKVLVKFKYCLNKIYLKFETLIDSEDKQQLNQLEDEFNSLNKSEEQTIDLNVKSNVENNEEITENHNQIEDKKTEAFNGNTTEMFDKNVRRSGRTERIVYKIRALQPKPNSKPKPKAVPKVLEIPDPEVEPNSLLLLRRNNFNEKTQSYVCPNPLCYKSFKCSKLLYIHFKVVHYLSKTLICNHLNCNKSFKTRSVLINHQKTHSDIRPFVCDFKGCDYSCKFQQSLDSHRVIHTNDRSFKCSECQKLFKSNERLRAHKKIHETKPSYVCRFDGCDQSFWKLYQLIKHQMSCHNHKLKVHSCEWPGCDFSNRSLSRFRDHQRSHTGERPFVCDWPGCGHRFRTDKDLKKHLLIHKDLRPFACDWPGCQHRCRNSSNLKQHMRVHQK